MNLMFFCLNYSSLTARHAEFSSASVRGEGQEKARGEILKRVQDDVSLSTDKFWMTDGIGSLLIAHNSSLITQSYTLPSIEGGAGGRVLTLSQ